MTVGTYDVVVIGGGISGLTAAYELTKLCGSTVKVCVLEAKDRVGGRTETITLKGNAGPDRWDIGGQWVGPTQSHLIALLKELKIELYEQYVTGTKLCQIAGTKIRSYNSSLPVFSLQPLESYNFIKYFAGMERLSKRVSIADPFGYDVDWASKTDSLSAAEYIRQECNDSLYMNELLEVASYASLGIHPSRVSQLYLDAYGNAAGSFRDMLEATDNGAQVYRIKGGSQQISEELAQRVSEHNVIRLSTPVNRIVQNTRMEVDADSADYPVLLYTDSGDEIQCQRVVLAIPPSEAAKIRIEPILPEDKRQLIGNFPMGNLIKFIATYSTPFWREAGMSGEIAATGRTEDPDRVNPVLVTFDATTSNGSPAIIGFISLEWCERPVEERKAAVLADLSRFLGPMALGCLDYSDRNWSEIPYNGGCPVGIIPVGGMKYFATAIRTITGNLHWGATETATNWPGYMSGAVQAGLRCAHEVLYHIAPAKVVEAKLDGSQLSKTYKKPTVPVVPYSCQSKTRCARLLQYCGMAIAGVALYQLIKRSPSLRQPFHK